ncbi:MAG: type 4a pilus biogenesis protein PilO [Synergistetes bacterium]|nr:type 4a pilus biogenesis protein PilO [Synergistota bacterium]
MMWSLGALGLILFYLFLTLRIGDELKSLEERSRRLTLEVRRLEAQIVKSKQLKKKLQELSVMVNSYKAFLPKSEDIDKIAILLGSSARNSGLTFDKLVFTRDKRAKKCIFNMRLSGNFSSLLDFLDKIWRAPFLIGVTSLRISALSEPSLLRVDITLATIER